MGDVNLSAELRHVLYYGNQLTSNRIAPFEAMNVFIREAPPTEFDSCVVADNLSPCHDTLSSREKSFILVEFGSLNPIILSKDEFFTSSDQDFCPITKCSLLE